MIRVALPTFNTLTALADDQVECAGAVIDCARVRRLAFAALAELTGRQEG